MKRFSAILCLFVIFSLQGEEPSRTWTSKQGLTMQGAMVGVESGMVIIKKTSGDIFKAKLEALSQADIDYVNAVSFGSTSTPDEKRAPNEKTSPGVKVTELSSTNVSIKTSTSTSSAGDDLFGDTAPTGKIIKVTLIVDPNPMSPSIKEMGVSVRPKLNDSVQLHVSMANHQPPETFHDSTWTIEALDSVSGTLKPTSDPLAQPLKTENMFYFLTYSVENHLQGPSTIPIPIITDVKGRKYYPLTTEPNHADAYLPEGMLSAEKDFLQPGLKKRFCSIYELPKECSLSSIEAFPIRMTRNLGYGLLIRNGQLQGKSIDISSGTTSSSSSDDTSGTNVSKADSPTEKTSVFMTCRQKTLKNASETSYSKTRILAYSIDLRLTKPQQKEMTIRAYFIATDSSGDAIVDTAEQSISLQQGKGFSTTVESSPISEGSSYYYSYGSKLKGVIIQLWADGNIVQSWCSMSQWEKYAKMPDIQKKMRSIEKKPSSEMEHNIRDGNFPKNRSGMFKPDKR